MGQTQSSTYKEKNTKNKLKQLENKTKSITQAIS